MFGRVTGLGGTTGFSGFILSRLKNTALQHRTNRKGITMKTKICVSVIPMNRVVLSVKGAAPHALAHRLRRPKLGRQNLLGKTR